MAIIILRELCDSLVFDIPWLKGTHLSRKIYFHEVGRNQLISGWDHRFILPVGGLCRIKAYKDGDVVYSDAISVSLTNDKDFLMYNWNEITENSDNSIGYVNFVDEKHEFASTHYVVSEIPIAKVWLSKSADDTLEWLYEYLCKFTKSHCIVASPKHKSNMANSLLIPKKEKLHNIFGKQTTHT